MKLFSPAFANGQEIPKKYTCLGENINPPLQIQEPPRETKSFVLIVEDTNATPKPWVHWLLFNIPSITQEIPQDFVPKGGIEGICNGGTFGYEGPCPRYFTGKHTYNFNLYALNTSLDISNKSDKDSVLTAAKNHIITTAHLTGVCTSNK